VESEPIDYERQPPLRARRPVGPILIRVAFILLLMILGALLLLLTGFFFFALRQGR